MSVEENAKRFRRVKIVPNDTPDADGVWVVVRYPEEPVAKYNSHCPVKGFHNVAFQTMTTTDVANALHQGRVLDYKKEWADE